MKLNEEAIDNQLHEARQMMLDLFGDDDTLTIEQVSKLIYLAYAKGYVDAIREEDPDTRARLAEALGILNRSTGEIL